MENLESYRSFKQVLNEFYKDELEKSDRNIAVENLDYNNIKIINLIYTKISPIFVSAKRKKTKAAKNIHTNKKVQL